MFSRIIKSPWVSLASGLILMVSSGFEVYSEIADAKIGAHHGLLVYGFVMILRTIPDLHHGLENLGRGMGVR